MKKIVFTILILAVFLLGFTAGKIEDGSLLGNKKMTQVGIITDDIEKTAGAWANFLGVPVPEIKIAEGHPSRPTAFMGEASNAKAKLAFFQLENLTVELIEPMGGSSTWQAFLDEKGPGLHHIAFRVDDMEPMVKLLGNNGIPEVQHGGWGTGEYAYLDGSGSLELIIELLEDYKK